MNKNSLKKQIEVILSADTSVNILLENINEWLSLSKIYNHNLSVLSSGVIHLMKNLLSL